MPYECCAWKDICEDIDKALDVNYEPRGSLPVKAAQLYPKGVRF